MQMVRSVFIHWNEYQCNHTGGDVIFMHMTPVIPLWFEILSGVGSEPAMEDLAVEDGRRFNRLRIYDHL